MEFVAYVVQHKRSIIPQTTKLGGTVSDSTTTTNWKQLITDVFNRREGESKTKPTENASDTICSCKNANTICSFSEDDYSVDAKDELRIILAGLPLDDYDVWREEDFL